MAKRNFQKEPLSPAEAAAAKAARILDLRSQAETLSLEAAKLCEELAEYCDEVEIKSGELIGSVQAIRRAQPVKLDGDGLTKKEVDYAKEQLLSQLPEFGKTTLDTTRMYNALATHPTLKFILNEKSLTLSQQTVWTFKAAA